MATLTVSRSVGDNLPRDSTAGLDEDLVDAERRLHGVGLVVNPLELLGGSALAFDTVKQITDNFPVPSENRELVQRYTTR
jgi:hypothetical protein